VSVQDSYLCWLDSMGTKWWHDSADKAEVERALSQSACGVTTNPVLVYQALQADSSSLASLSGGRGTTEVLLQSVIAGVAELLRPVYRRTAGRHGYVCAQVDPRLAEDGGRMLDMARRFSSWAPNIAVKLPVTKDGLEVLEECVAEGITTVGTVSFTVPQVVAVGESHKKGSLRARRNGRKPGNCFAVIMIGRLDDYLIDITSGSDPDASTLRYAGIATVKHAQPHVQAQGYEALLRVAALRGSYHVEHLTGGNLVLSIHPKYQFVLLNDKIPRVGERIHEPVDQRILERLLKVKEFRKAYEADGLKPDEFISYGATQRTLTQFVQEGWLRLASLGEHV
jgi:transaldolase